MNNNRTIIFVMTVFLLAAALACGPSGRVSIQPTPTVTLTSLPTAVVTAAQEQATPTVSPSPNPTPVPRRVNFETGAISAKVAANLTQNGVSAYILYVLKGQNMTVEVTYPPDISGRIALTIIAPDGTILAQPATGQTNWSGTIPENGDYIIQVVWLGESPTNYTLTITIPPLGGSGSDYCEVTNLTTLTAYHESSTLATVFGTAEAGTKVLALARTTDGWLGFDPGVAQAGNEGRARLRWYLPDWSHLTFDPAGCENNLPYLLSYASIANGTYNLSGTSVTLKNGKYVNSASKEGSIHTVDMSAVAFGDMNGDGTEDAIVTLGTNMGGSGTFVEFALVLNTSGQPKHVSSISIGDRSVVNAIYIADHILTANLTVHGPSDPLCCPTMEVTWLFQFHDGNLIQLP